MINDIRTSEIYYTLNHKFPVGEIKIDTETRKKIIPAMPMNWTNIRGDRTRYDTINLAILTGSINNIIIVDLDIPKNDDEISGKDSWEWEFGNLENLNTLITKTISGGYHLYFKYDKRLPTNITKLFGLNIDIKTNGGCAFEGQNYTLFKDATELMDIGFFIEHKEQVERDIELIEKSEKEYIKTDISEHIITEILNLLNNGYCEKYNYWIKIGIILKNAGYDFEIFNEWSKKASSYSNKEDTLKKWNTFKDIYKCGIGTLMYYFKKSVNNDIYRKFTKRIYKKKGEKPVPKENIFSCDYTKYLFSEGMNDELLKYINKFCAIVDDPECFLITPRLNETPYIRKNLLHFIPTKIFNEWRYMDSARRFKQFEFIINDNLVNPENYNLYIRPKFENYFGSLEELCPNFSKLLWLVGNKTEEGYEYILSWIAKMVQVGKTKQALVLMGDMGIGKGTLGECLFSIIQNKYCRKLEDINAVGNKFNADVESSILTIIEEVASDAGTYHKIQEILKKQITDQDMSVEKKGIHPYFIIDNNNFILITNNINPVNITNSNRRYYIVKMADDFKNDYNFFRLLRKEVELNIEKIRGFFYNYEFKEDLNSIRPTTDAETELLEINKSPIEIFVDTLNKNSYTKEDMETIDGLYDEYILFCSMGKFKPLNKSYFSKMIQQNKGWKTIRKRQDGIKTTFIYHEEQYL